MRYFLAVQVTSTKILHIQISEFFYYKNKLLHKIKRREIVFPDGISIKFSRFETLKFDASYMSQDKFCGNACVVFLIQNFQLLQELSQILVMTT